MSAGARECRGRAEDLLQLRHLFPQAPVRERTVGERADRSGLGSRGERHGKKNDDVRALFLFLLRVLWKPASRSVLDVIGTFWLTSFAKFAKWQGSFPLDNSQ